MKVQHQSSNVYTVYAPKSANLDALNRLGTIYGMTTWDAIGTWPHEGELVVELVQVFTFCLPVAPEYSVGQAGEDFLKDNPNEKAFLATSAMGSVTIYQDAN